MRVGLPYQALGLPASKQTHTGRPSTSLDVLETLPQDIKAVRLITDYKRLSSLASQLGKELPACVRDGRLHGDLSPVGTHTGRLASHNPNLQNLPSRGENGSIARSIIAAADGNALICADCSQLEMRLLAHASGDPHLIEACAHDDIHTANARRIRGLPDAEYARLAEDDKKQARATAKQIGFAINYGAGPDTIGARAGISIAEAEDLIDSIDRLYPSVQDWKDDTLGRLRHDGHVTTIEGRRRRLRAAGAPAEVARAERQAINAVIQGSAADVANRAMLPCARDKLLVDLDCRLLLQIHDELLFEVPKKHADRAAARVKELMESAHTLHVPLVVEVGIGATCWDAK